MLKYLLVCAVLSLCAANDDDTGSVVKFSVDIDPKTVEVDTRRRGHNHRDKSLRTQNKYKVQIEKGNLRIRGGNVTDTRNYPYMAAIIINGKLWCAGAIVDENWVLTAAHCLNYVLHVSPLRSLSKFVKIRVGSSHAHEGGRLVDVVGAVRHPKFEEEPVPHADVALLKLSENLVFSATINLIKIYEGTREPFAQSFVVATGWGATRGSDTAFRDHTSDLLSARLKVRTQQYCVDAYQLVNGFLFTKDFFCASLRNGTRDVCLVWCPSWFHSNKKSGSDKDLRSDVVSAINYRFFDFYRLKRFVFDTCYLMVHQEPPSYHKTPQRIKITC